MIRSVQFSIALVMVLFLGDLVSKLDLGDVNLTGCFLGTVNAQSEEEEEEKPEDPRPERKPKALSIEFFQQMEKFTKAYDEEEDIEKARELLDRMLDRARRWNDAELAVLHQRYARLGFDVDDMDLVVKHLEHLLEYSENVIYAIEEMTLFQLAQVHSNRMDDYETALDFVQQWLDLKLDWEEDGRAYAFISNVYTRKEDYAQAIHWMKRAIEKEQEKGKAIEETWWRILLQGYLSLASDAVVGSDEHIKQLTNALDLTRFLLIEYIEKMEYWNILSQVYVQTGSAMEDSANFDEVEADQYSTYSGYTLEGAYLFDLFTSESEYLRLVRSVANQGAFTRAAWMLQEGFDLEIVKHNFENLKRLGQYLQRSVELEKAAAAYEKAVALKGEANVLYLIATIYQSLEKFSQCVSFADQALNATEGELSQPHQVKFFKGTCQFLDGQLGAAEETYTELRDDIGANPEQPRLRSLLNSIDSYEKFIANERGRIEYKSNVEKAWKEYNEEKALAR